MVSPPVQFPDLNVIENLWAKFDMTIRKRSISNKNDLKNAPLEERVKISPEVTKKLVFSVETRIKEVIKQNGGHTKY